MDSFYTYFTVLVLIPLASIGRGKKVKRTHHHFKATNHLYVIPQGHYAGGGESVGESAE